MADSELVFLAFSGSLRVASFNTATLRALAELAPSGVRIDEAQIADVPLYNDDERQQGYPASVKRLREQVRNADAIIFVTPEYNYSIPGVLKNTIDWISRPPDQPFAGKPASMMGASGGLLGTVRAQYHLRQIGVYLDLKFINGPEIMIGNAATRFDTERRLVDEPTRELLRKHLLALRDWTLVVRHGPAALA